MDERVVKITKKGQATIPKRWRDRFGFEDKAIVIPTVHGVMFRPLPPLADERGSLKSLFGDLTAEDILKEDRQEDVRREHRLERI